jgi:large subunit ribosomal protein L24
MQKVIRRTILAEKQAARRLRKRKDIQQRERQKTIREQNAFTRREVMQGLKSRRFERREDWELGPLAPRRDVGNKKDTFGAVSTQLLKGPVLTVAEREEKLKDWGGSRLNLSRLNLVTGDRVVLLEGRDKGKIGKVTATDKYRAECTVQGLNMVGTTSPPSRTSIGLNANLKCSRWT